MVATVMDEYWSVGGVMAFQYAAEPMPMPPAVADWHKSDEISKALEPGKVVQLPPSLSGFSFARVKLSEAN
jgi:hypothetical protein